MYGNTNDDESNGSKAPITAAIIVALAVALLFGISIVFQGELHF